MDHNHTNTNSSQVLNSNYQHSLENQLQEARKRAEEYADYAESVKSQETASLRQLEMKWVNSYEEKSATVEQLERQLASTVDALVQSRNINQHQNQNQMRNSFDSNHGSSHASNHGMFGVTSVHSSIDATGNVTATGNGNVPLNNNYIPVTQANQYQHYEHYEPQFDYNQQQSNSNRSVSGNNSHAAQQSFNIYNNSHNNSHGNYSTTNTSIPHSNSNSNSNPPMQHMQQVQPPVSISTVQVNLMEENKMLYSKIDTLKGDVSRLQGDRDMLRVSLTDTNGKLKFRCQQVQEYERELQIKIQSHSELKC